MTWISYSIILYVLSCICPYCEGYSMSCSLQIHFSQRAVSPLRTFVFSMVFNVYKTVHVYWREIFSLQMAIIIVKLQIAGCCSCQLFDITDNWGYTGWPDISGRAGMLRVLLLLMNWMWYLFCRYWISNVAALQGTIETFINQKKLISLIFSFPIWY